MRFYLVILLLIGFACGPELKNSLEIASPYSDLSDVERAKIVSDDLGAKLVCPASDQTPDKISIITDVDTPYKDLNREIKDLGTDFVVNEFFNTPETLFNFLRLVYGRIDGVIKHYREERKLPKDAIVFIFKGGNVMRMLANETFKAVPPEASKILRDRYAEFFKRSDADFTVLVDHKKLPRSLNYDKVMDDLTKKTYETLNSVRNELTNNPDRYSNFLQLNSEMAGQRLSEYFKNLEKISALTDKENSKWFGAKFAQMQLQDDRAQIAPTCQYLGQFDYLYQFDRHDKNKIIGIPLNNRSKWIMNTINKTLQWPSGLNPKDLIKFYLVRSKIQFEYTYTKDGVAGRLPIGGELIDVSFPHKLDFRLAKFFRNLKKGIADYRITFSETGESIALKAESINGLAIDLQEVVFEQFPRPWQASKYTKRINRLFFFGLIDMLRAFGVGAKDYQSYADDIEKHVLTPMEQILPLREESKRMAKTAEQGVLALAKYYPEMPIINNFFQAVSELTLHRFFKNPLDDDQEQFKEMIGVIKENLEIMRKLAEVPARSVDTTKLTDVDMSSLF